MFIRRTRTRRTDTGQDYFTCRLVRAERVGEKVRQRTLLNLGSHYAIERTQWPTLCARIEHLLSGQTELLDPDCPGGAGNRSATHRRATAGPRPGVYRCGRPGRGRTQCGRRFAGAAAAAFSGGGSGRAVGTATTGRAGVTGTAGVDRAATGGGAGIDYRAPGGAGSERATHAWLGQRSALGELLGVDFEALSAMQLYRASDALLAHRDDLEHHLFRQVSDLFDLSPTVTLYDLTNTYFEGEAGVQPKARRGHSKEKRSDCPLLTLGLVLDGSGFVRRSQVFAGNVREDSTLADMLTALGAPAAALVVLDRGIATRPTFSRQGSA